MTLSEINERLNQISFMTEAINRDASVRKNLKEENPNIYFVREDLELTIMREDMLLKKLETVEEEYKNSCLSDERIENKIKFMRLTLLKLKSSDMGLLSYMDNNLKKQISIAEMLKEVGDGTNSNSGEK